MVPLAKTLMRKAPEGLKTTKIIVWWIKGYVEVHQYPSERTCVYDSKGDCSEKNYQMIFATKFLSCFSRFALLILVKGKYVFHLPCFLFGNRYIKSLPCQ